MIPNAAPSRLSPHERAAVTAAVAAVVDGERWILGPRVAAFEEEFADYLGSGTVVGVGNGTDAIAIALTALDLEPRSGVLVAENDGGYSSTACRMAGLVPVAMDVDPVTGVPGPAEAEQAMRDGVNAIVATRLHGEATDLTALNAWRIDHGLALIEDCSQAIGARINGQHVGSLGDASTFSFYPTKNLGALGDAGAIALADPAVAARARSLRQYGWNQRFKAELAGGRNSRLDELQAAVLSARLPFLDGRNDRRRAIAQRFRAAAIANGLGYFGDPSTSVAHHAVLISERRDALMEHLRSRSVDTVVHYPFLVSEMPGLAVERSLPSPVADEFRATKLSLPCFPELTEADIDSIVDAITSWTDHDR